MKTIAKRLFATVLALALVCTMVTGFAANTASVIKVEVLDSADDAEPTIYNTLEDIDVVEGQLIKVYASLTDAEEAAVADGDLTFLSRIAGDSVVLSNDTIQYVTQIEVDEAGEAIITFRPRTTLGTGTFVASVGGTGVAAATTFSYDVEKAIVTLNLTAQGATSIQEDNTTTNIVYTLENYTTGDLTVTLGENALEKDTEYTISGTTLTILNAAILKTVADYTLTVAGNGYEAATATIKVTKKPNVDLGFDVNNSIVEIYENDDENIQLSITGYTANDDLTVTITLEGGAILDADKYSLAGTLLTITDKTVGTHTVVISGDGYNSAQTTYTIIEKLATQLELSEATPAVIEADETRDIVFTVGGFTEGTLVVKVNNVELAADAYTFENGTLTLLNAKLDKTPGEYIVEISGEDYLANDSTFEVVADSSSKLTITGTNAPVEVDDANATLVFTVTGYVEGNAMRVAIGENVLTETTDYTFVDGTLTILNAAIPDTVDTHTVTVSGDKYYSDSAEFTVYKQKVVTPDDPIEDEDVAQDAQDAINNLDPEVSVNETTGVIESVTLKDKVQVGETEYNVTNEVVTSDAALTYDVNSGVISYNPEAEGAHFVSKAVVTTSISSTGSIKKTETIYFIPKDTKITFGNVTAIANGDGDDAFGTKADFENALANNSTELLATRVNALNAVLGRKANIAQEIETLDYDQNTTITLNEYRIFKLMLDNDADNHPAFLYENVIGNRDDYKVSE